MAALSPELIAAYSLNNENNSVQLHQTTHRINLTKSWKISPSSKILEIGCGQGDTTAVLASSIGESGHVDAIDPAPLSYGSPFTLGQAQSHLSSSPLGARIRWHESTLVSFLESEEGRGREWDVAILAHSIWYFPTPSILISIAQALLGRVKRVCIAECALSTHSMEAQPHILAAFATATFEAHKGISEANIQNILSPGEITTIFEEAGWKIERDEIVTPDAELEDGGWEVGAVVHEGFLEEVDASDADERVKLVLRSMREAVVKATEKVGGVKGVRTQDVWVASFVQK